MSDIVPDFHAVAIKETGYYRIDPEDAPFIKDIFQTYVFDMNERTFCCEITPSYSLEPVYTSVEFTTDTPDEVRERLSEKYECEPSDHSYMHCSRVQGYIKAHPDRHHHYGEGESLDEAREFYQGNHVI
jgi:hypothetical protein